MNKRGTAWWGWWQKKYIPPPAHADANLGTFASDLVASGGPVAGITVSLSGFSTSISGYSGGASALKGPSITIEVTGTLDGYATADLNGFSTAITAHGLNGAVGTTVNLAYGIESLSGFELTLDAHGGGYAHLDSVASTLNSYGGGSAAITSFDSVIAGVGTTGSVTSTTLKGPARSLSTYGGASVTLSSFTAIASGAGVTGFYGVANLRGPTSSLQASAHSLDYGVATLSAPNMSLVWGAATLNGFATQLVSGAQIQQNPAFAYAMNIHSAETSIYTNYDFSYIIRLGASYYGVKSDGLYLLEGATDADTAINARIKTSMMDFETALHKRVPYVYLDTEFDTTITPYVEGAATGEYTAGFNGRRTHLARGPRGRQWEFEVKNVDGGDMKLGSLEALAQVITRKV